MAFSLMPAGQSPGCCCLARPHPVSDEMPVFPQWEDTTQLTLLRVILSLSSPTPSTTLKSSRGNTDLAFERGTGEVSGKAKNSCGKRLGWWKGNSYSWQNQVSHQRWPPKVTSEVRSECPRATSWLEKKQIHQQRKSQRKYISVIF